jgi:hypothetical protein
VIAGVLAAVPLLLLTLMHIFEVRSTGCAGRRTEVPKVG